MRVVAARKTTLKSISIDTAKEFVQANHSAGMARPGTKVQCYGLYLNEELLAVAIFSNPRTRAKQRKYTSELFRLAFKEGVRIQGGASKLIKHFTKLPNTLDLFTYQDTSGEATNVYEKCGLTLVGDSFPIKKILVRDSLTHKDSKNNHFDWFSIEHAAKRGPDALIGTTLGEVIEDGKRISNIDLFLRSGYHIEEIPGDRVYEWHNPEFRFYTYKITSTVDDNYYYGRHQTKLTTREEMTNDGYMGSGGVKFQNWINLVGEEKLKKTVLGVYSTWAESVKAEESLIKDKYKTDTRCKNSKPGGTGLTSYFPEHTLKNCEIHGKTLHQGNSCKKCSLAKSLLEEECSAHGVTKFRNSQCLRCEALKRRSLELCPIHGVTKHHGESCEKCLAEKVYSMRECGVHGLTQHMGKVCKRCVANDSISIKECPKHGNTKHIGDICRKCISDRNISIKTCEVHGEALHQAGTCAKCVREKSSNLGVCPKHGETKFIGRTCATCSALKGVNIRECPVHGSTKHMGEHCKKCMAAKVWTVEECSVHSMSKHRSGKCVKCSIAAKNN